MKKISLSNKKKLIAAVVIIGVVYAVAMVCIHLFVDALASVNKHILFFAVSLLFVVILLAIFLFDRFFGVMVTLKNFVDSVEKGSIDYSSVSFPESPWGEIGNKMISLYKQLETSKLQIIEEKDRNRKRNSKLS